MEFGYWHDGSHLTMNFFSSIMNLLQAGRFRKLIGTMSPPDDTDQAEIYVEVRQMFMLSSKKLCNHRCLNRKRSVTIRHPTGKAKNGGWLCSMVQEGKRGPESDGWS